VRHPDVFRKDSDMSNVIYIVGLVVVILAVLSFFGLR
jgi:small-conductance mechanosensitive channel